MMRNREFRSFLIALIIAGAALTGAGFVLSLSAGIVAAACSLIFISLCLFYTYRRYVQLRLLSDYLKRINTGD